MVNAGTGNGKSHLVADFAERVNQTGNERVAVSVTFNNSFEPPNVEKPENRLVAAILFRLLAVPSASKDLKAKWDDWTECWEGSSYLKKLRLVPFIKSLDDYFGQKYYFMFMIDEPGRVMGDIHRQESARMIFAATHSSRFYNERFRFLFTSPWPLYTLKEYLGMRNKMNWIYLKSADDETIVGKTKKFLHDKLQPFRSCVSEAELNRMIECIIIYGSGHWRTITATVNWLLESHRKTFYRLKHLPREMFEQLMAVPEGHPRVARCAIVPYGYILTKVLLHTEVKLEDPIMSLGDGEPLQHSAGSVRSVTFIDAMMNSWINVITIKKELKETQLLPRIVLTHLSAWCDLLLTDAPRKVNAQEDVFGKKTAYSDADVRFAELVQQIMGDGRYSEEGKGFGRSLVALFTAKLLAWKKSDSSPALALMSLEEFLPGFRAVMVHQKDEESGSIEGLVRPDTADEDPQLILLKGSTAFHKGYGYKTNRRRTTAQNRDAEHAYRKEVVKSWSISPPSTIQLGSVVFPGSETNPYADGAAVVRVKRQTAETPLALILLQMKYSEDSVSTTYGTPQLEHSLALLMKDLGVLFFRTAEEAEEAKEYANEIAKLGILMKNVVFVLCAMHKCTLKDEDVKKTALKFGFTGTIAFSDGKEGMQKFYGPTFAGIPLLLFAKDTSYSDHDRVSYYERKGAA